MSHLELSRLNQRAAARRDWTQVLIDLRAGAPDRPAARRVKPPQIAGCSSPGGATEAVNAAYAQARRVPALRPMMTLTHARVTERIGRNLTRAREAAGLSKQQAADAFGPPMRRNEIRRAENGQHRPSEEKLLRYAEIYQVDISYFYAPYGDETDDDEDTAA
jgi:hypothetical protein